MFKLLEKILIPFVTILIIFSANAAYSSSKEFVLHVEGIVGTQCNTWASRYFGTQKAMVTELLIKVDEGGIISGTSKIISGNTFIRDNLDPKYNKKKGDKWAGGDVWSVSGTMTLDGDILVEVDLGERKHWALVTSLRGNVKTQKLFAASGRQTCINWRNVSVHNSKINLSESSASSTKNNNEEGLTSNIQIVPEDNNFDGEYYGEGKVTYDSENFQYNDACPPWKKNFNLSWDPTYVLEVTIKNKIITGYGYYKLGQNNKKFKNLKNKVSVSGSVNDNGQIKIKYNDNNRSGKVHPYLFSGKIEDYKTAEMYVSIVNKECYLFSAIKLDKKVSITNDTIKIAFNGFNKNDRVNIQEALSNLEVYSSKIDGAYGPSTKQAILKHLQNNEVPLEEIAQIITELNKLLVIEVQNDNLENVNNNGGDELSAAKTIIKDSEEFLKSGAGSFTLEFAKKYSAVREILNGKWNATLKDNFINFKEYVYSNKDFKKYSDMQNNKRIEGALDAISNNMQLLQNLRDKLKKWLQKNLIHEKAGSVYDLVARCDELLNSNNYDDFELTIINAAKLARELEILD